MSLAAGSSVGPYDVIAPIGAGGMGEVYRARDRRLGREVALKILPASKLVNEDRKQRFIQEAKTASSLNHPNIVTIYDIGSEAGVEYIAMEFVRGRTLDEVIPEKGLRLNEVLRLSIAIADALAKAHAAGIVHRDLKPSNIMVTEDGQVKLLDFGLAKLVDSGLSDTENTMSIAPARTIEGTILGTVSYMSPEQAKGMPVDARSDIFSFGVLVYEMVTGRRAFKSVSPIATLSAILTEDPERISSVTADIPPELERVIARCMKKEPEKRWQNMKDVKVALEELKEESDSGTLTTARIQLPPIKREKRGWGWLGITVSVCAIILCGGLVALVLSNQQNHAVLVAKALEEKAAKENHTTASEQAKLSAAGPVAANDEALTNDSIIQLVKAHVSIPIITGHIRNSKTNFDLSTKELIRLANAGVPENLIETMRDPKGSPRQEASRVVALAPATPPPAAPVAPTPAHASRITVPDATQVTIVLGPESFASARADVGDIVKFVVRDNVVVNDSLVVAKGAVATGTITDTERKHIFGRGRLLMKFDYVTAVDGEHLPIRATPISDSAGRSVPFTHGPAELVMGLPVFITGPAEVKSAQLQ